MSCRGGSAEMGEGLPSPEDWRVAVDGEKSDDGFRSTFDEGDGVSTDGQERGDGKVPDDVFEPTDGDGVFLHWPNEQLRIWLSPDGQGFPPFSAFLKIT